MVRKKIIMISFILILCLIPGCLNNEEESYPPTAIILMNSSKVEVNETIQFDGSNSTGNGSRVIDYVWEIGNTTQDFKVISHNRTFSTSFVKPGYYWVKLTVINEDGEKNSTISIIEVIEIQFIRVVLNYSYSELYAFIVNESKVVNITKDFLFLHIQSGYAIKIGVDEGYLNFSNTHVRIWNGHFEYYINMSHFAIRDAFSFLWYRYYGFENIKIYDTWGLKYASEIPFEKEIIIRKSSINFTIEYGFDIPVEYRNDSYIFQNYFMEDNEYWIPKNGMFTEELSLSDIERNDYTVIYFNRTREDFILYYNLNFRINNNDYEIIRSGNVNVTIDGKLFNIYFDSFFYSPLSFYYDMRSPSGRLMIEMAR